MAWLEQQKTQIELLTQLIQYHNLPTPEPG